MFGNCCTSYDIPLQLVVYAQGKVHRFTGVGLPIFQWGFADRGTRIAYGQETVHFACATHYELPDIASERTSGSDLRLLEFSGAPFWRGPRAWRRTDDQEDFRVVVEDAGGRRCPHRPERSRGAGSVAAPSYRGRSRDLVGRELGELGGIDGHARRGVGRLRERARDPYDPA
jgi:hypothetical protein